MDRLDAVARRPHPLGLGAHPVVDRDAPRTGRAGSRPRGRARRSAARRAPARRGPRAAACPDAVCTATPGRPRRSRSRRRRRTCTSVMPMSAHGVGDELADVGVEGAHGGRRAVDDGDVQAAHLAGLGHLQADVAAPDDHDALHVAAVQLGAQCGAVVEGLHAVHAGRVDPRHRRARRDAARGVDEVVERLVVLPAGRRGRGRGPCARPGRSRPPRCASACRCRCRRCFSGRAGDELVHVARRRR